MFRLVAHRCDRAEGCTVAIGKEERAQVTVEQFLGMGGNALQHGLCFEAGGYVASHIGQRSHLARAALRLGMKLGGVDGRARVRRDRGQQAQIVVVEHALLRRALHAQHADGLPARLDRYTQIRKRLPAHQCGAKLLAAFLNILVDQQRFAGLDDLAREPLAQFQRIERLADLIREADEIRLPIQQRHVDDICLEDLPHLTSDKLDHRIEFRFSHERLTHRADGGKFPRALLLGIEETRVLEGDAHTARQRLQQAHIRFGEGIFTLEVLQAEIPVDLRACSKRDEDQ